MSEKITSINKQGFARSSSTSQRSQEPGVVISFFTRAPVAESEVRQATILQFPPQPAPETVSAEERDRNVVSLDSRVRQLEAPDVPGAYRSQEHELRLIQGMVEESIQAREATPSLTVIRAADNSPLTESRFHVALGDSDGLDFDDL